MPSPLFAAEDWHVGLLGVLTVLGPAAVWYLGWLRERRRTSLEEWQEIVRRQDQQITALAEAHEECRRREIVLQRAIVHLHAVSCQMADALRRAGVSSVPEVKPIEEFLPPDDEMRTRQVQQNTALVRAEASKAVPPTPPGRP